MSGAALRRDYRFASRIPVVYERNGTAVSSFATNVSVNGMFIETPVALVLGDTLLLSLDDDHGDQVSLRGRVVGVSASDARPGAHIEVVGGADTLRELIARTILPKLAQSVASAWPSVHQILSFVTTQGSPVASTPGEDERDLLPIDLPSTLVLERAATSAAAATPVLRDLQVLVRAALTVAPVAELQRYAKRFDELASHVSTEEQLAEIDQRQAELDEARLALGDRALLQHKLDAATAQVERLQRELRDALQAHQQSESVIRELRAARDKT